MEGSLTRRSPADVLSEAQKKRLSGVLTYRLDRVTRQLHIDAGVHIRFAASNHPGESLTAWFLERGRVTEEQLRRAALDRRPDEFLGATLLRLGLIARPDLVELTEMHIRRIARAAMRMSDGTYQFQEGAAALHEQMGGGILTAELLLEWTRDLNDPEWIRRRLGPPNSRIVRHPRPPEGYQRIRLDPVEGYIMSRVDGAATVREICMVSPMGDDRTLCALFGLALAGVLEMPAGAAELPAPSAGSHAAALPLTGKAVPSAPPPPTSHSAPPAPASSAVLSHASGAPSGHRSVAPGPQPAAPRPAPAPATRPPSNPAPQTAGNPLPAPPATTISKPQAPPAAQPASAARPGRIGLVPKPRSPLAGARRPGRLIRRPIAPIPKPAGFPDRPAVEAAADVEAEMLRRFRDIHVLDLYQVLEVSPSATPEMIRRSYYALARRLHPDTFGREDLKPKAEQVFGRITEAYSTLSQQAPREKYDEERQSRSSRQEDRQTDTASVARMNFLHGREHFEHGRLSEALSFLQNACQQDPTRAEYFEYLGAAQARNPRLRKQAEENLLAAIRIAPMSANAYAHLGHLYERIGATDRARDMYRKALEWDPANEIALKGLEAEGSTRKGILGLFSRK